MIYDDNDDPLQTSGLGTCVVAAGLQCHVVLVACNNNKRKDFDHDVNFVFLSFSKLRQLSETRRKFFNTTLVLPRAHRALYITVSTNLIKLKFYLHLYQKLLSCQSVKYKLQSHT